MILFCIHDQTLHFSILAVCVNHYGYYDKMWGVGIQTTEKVTFFGDKVSYIWNWPWTAPLSVDWNYICASPQPIHEVLGTDPRSSFMLGKYSTNWTTSPLPHGFSLWTGSTAYTRTVRPKIMAEERCLPQGSQEAERGKASAIIYSPKHTLSNQLPSSGPT